MYERVVTVGQNLMIIQNMVRTACTLCFLYTLVSSRSAYNSNDNERYMYSLTVYMHVYRSVLEVDEYINNG